MCVCVRVHAGSLVVWVSMWMCVCEEYGCVICSMILVWLLFSSVSLTHVQNVLPLTPTYSLHQPTSSHPHILILLQTKASYERTSVGNYRIRSRRCWRVCSDLFTEGSRSLEFCLWESWNLTGLSLWLSRIKQGTPCSYMSSYRLVFVKLFAYICGPAIKIQCSGLGVFSLFINEDHRCSMDH